MHAKNFLLLFVFLVLFVNVQAQTSQESDSLIHQLQEVVITAKQPVTKLVGSTLVSSIPGSNLANLGNALDVLAQLPMIKVEDDAVSVIGKTNIEIYIDGLPMRDNQELQQLLSSNLKKVELNMAPGAAYESTTGAVLKITTRRSFAQGISFSDQLQWQCRRKCSIMDNLTLSYRTGSWEIFGNGTVNYNNSLAKGTTTNTFVYNDQATVVGSRQLNSFPTTTGIIKIGLNYSKGNQSFGAYYRFNPERGDFENNGSEWLDNIPPLMRDINKRIRAHGHQGSVYYENCFNDKYLLHFDGDFSISFNNNCISTIYPSSAHQIVKSKDERKSRLWAGKLYMNAPLFCGDFTVGTQESFTHTTLDYHMLNQQVGQYIPSTFTEASQTAASAFVSWARQLGQFSLSVGARYEYVSYDFKVDGRRDEDVSRKYNLLTPDLSVGYTFNDDSQLSLSYKLATVKPPYAQLTGSLSYVGLHEIEGGNPKLRDEKMHDIQLFGMWKGFMLQTDFVRSFDTYAFVKQLYPADDLQLIMHPVNIDISALSCYVVWSQPVRRWTPNITVGVYRQWLTLDNVKYDKPIFSYDIDNTFSLPGGWSATVNISGRSQGDMHTNRFGATLFSADASLGKALLNKSLTLKLSATDIFNTANYDWTMLTYGVFVDKRQNYDRRGISLNIIYNFQPRKSNYKGKSAAEDEMNRL